MSKYSERAAAEEASVIEIVRKNPGISGRMIAERFGWTYDKANQRLHSLLLARKLTFTRAQNEPRKWTVME